MADMNGYGTQPDSVGQEPLVSEKKMPGTFRVIWDGKDDAGREVSSGSYIARLTQWGIGAGDFPIKITLVR